MFELGIAFRDLLLALWHLLLYFFLTWSLLAAWLAWSLWAINWPRVWPVLRQGAWLPGVLIAVMAALAWSQLSPAECTCLGVFTIPNFWWQLGDVALVVAGTLFCGWLQGYFGWQPRDIDLEPSPAGAGHDHGHH